MRGLAAGMVVFHHVYTRFYYLFEGKYPEWFQNILHFISELNVEAVLFFFFLSGFSICLSLKNGMPVTKEKFNEYAYRRLKRIMPLYYFAILFTIICGLSIKTFAVNDDFSFKNLLGNILFLQSSKSYRGNWFAPYGDNGPLWSLSFEMFYYFLLPAFLFLLLKFYKSDKLTLFINRVALIASFIISIICVLVNKFFFFPYIAFASLFYVWYSGFFAASLYIKKKILPDKNFILLLSVTILAWLMNYISPSATLSKLFSGSCIAVIFMLIYSVRKKASLPIVAFIESGFNFLFYSLGKGSYALYLLHYPVLMVLKSIGSIQLWQMIAAMILLSVFCVLLEQYTVQRKWLILKRQFIK